MIYFVKLLSRIFVSIPEFGTMYARIIVRLISYSRKSQHFGKRINYIRSVSRYSSTKNLLKVERVPSGPSKLNELNDYSFVPISVVKQFLLFREVLFSEGPTCISIKCPSCESEDSVFINKVSSNFICRNCKISGTWNALESRLSNPNSTLEIPIDEEIAHGLRSWTKLCSCTSPIREEHLKARPLTNISVSLNVLKELNARIDVDSEEIYFPLTYHREPVGYITLKQDLTEESAPFKCAKGVLSTNRGTRRGGSAIVVATVKDFLALLASPLEQDIICLPHGQQTLPVEVLPLFEEYNKLILWFDNDSVSWGNMKMFAKKFSEERCSFVQPIESQPSPHQCISRGANIPEIIKNVKEVSHQSIITFAHLREDVLTELYNADKVSGVKWERFPALNTILKGHRRGELTILTGPTGAGKTTFISEYSLDLLSSGVTTLWGSFEIRNQRLAKTMMTQMFSAPLERNLDKYEEWADKFERLPLYFMTFHGQQPLETVMEAVKHATYVHDVIHVIIDNVQFMLGLSNNEVGFLDRFYRQDALIASFRNFATTSNCHVTLVIHPRKEREGEQLTASSIFGGAKAAQEADNILIIQHKMNHQSLRMKKYLQVAKNRYSGDLGIMPLEFDKESLSFQAKK